MPEKSTLLPLKTLTSLCIMCLCLAIPVVASAQAISKNSYRSGDTSRNFLHQASAGELMTSPISKPLFSHSGTPLLPGSPLKRSQSEPDLSHLQVAHGGSAPSKAIHDMSVESIDLSDSQARQQVKQLIHIVCDRQNLMPRMAELKVILGNKPFDAEQEQKVLDKAVEAGKSLQIPEKLVRVFMQGQMDMAKAIQQETMKTMEQNVKNYTDDEKAKAEQDKAELRSEIASKLVPLLTALQPLEANLSSLWVQKEIERQLDHMLLTGECSKPQTKELLKKSLQVQLPNTQ